MYVLVYCCAYKNAKYSGMAEDVELEALKISEMKNFIYLSLKQKRKKIITKAKSLKQLCMYVISVFITFRRLISHFFLYFLLICFIFDCR